MIFLGAALIALSTFLLILLLTAYTRYVRRKDLFMRLEKHNILLRQTFEEQQKTFTERSKEFLTSLAAPFKNLSAMQLLDIKMRQAGIPLLGSKFLIALIIFATLVGAAVWMLTLDRMIAGFSAVAVILIVWIIISLRIGKRKQIFIAQLGDALTTISNALRAGYSFQQSMDTVAKEMEPPISEEFSQVTREVLMGLPLEDSLESMNRRMESSDFALVVTAVNIQREVGGNLAQILDTISETINERIRMKREMYTLTAQGRLSAAIIFLLPYVVALFMYIVQPSQITVLFENPIGRIAVGGTFFMEFIGIIIIQRILDVKI